MEQIGYFMVLPNKYTMALTDDITTQDLKCPDSAGVLRVQLIKADALMKKDIGVMGLGKSDPYAILQVGAKTVKTKVINNTISPEWFFTADFPIEVVEGQELTVEVYDHDDPGNFTLKSLFLPSFQKLIFSLFGSIRTIKNMTKVISNWFLNTFFVFFSQFGSIRTVNQRP